MTPSTATSQSCPDEDPVSFDRGAERIRWKATERHGITSAPGSLALVHDLLNTHRSDNGEPDLLSSRDTAQQWVDRALRVWSSSSGHPYVPCRLGLNAVAVLRDLRDALGGPVGATRAGEPCCAASIEVSVELGAASWLPTGDGVERLRSTVLGEVLSSQCRGTWSRLRRCRYDSCGVTFFDRTWDQRQVWHDTTKPQSHRHPATHGERI